MQFFLHIKLITHRTIKKRFIQGTNFLFFTIKNQIGKSKIKASRKDYVMGKQKSLMKSFFNSCLKR